MKSHKEKGKVRKLEIEGQRQEMDILVDPSPRPGTTCSEVSEISTLNSVRKGSFWTGSFILGKVSVVRKAMSQGGPSRADTGGHPRIQDTAGYTSLPSCFQRIRTLEYVMGEGRR